MKRVMFLIVIISSHKTSYANIATYKSLQFIVINFSKFDKINILFLSRSRFLKLIKIIAYANILYFNIHSNSSVFKTICTNSARDFVICKPYEVFTLLDRHFIEIAGGWLSDDVIDAYMRCVTEEMVRKFIYSRYLIRAILCWTANNSPKKFKIQNYENCIIISRLMSYF